MTQYPLNTLNHPTDYNGNVITAKHVIIYPGSHALVFDNAEEKETYLNALIGWSKEAYSEQLNNAHKALFKKYYYDDLPPEERYESVGEISLWLDDEDYSAEAQTLSNWWRTTCKQVIDYLKDVTEETAVPINQYIESLPIPEF